MRRHAACAVRRIEGGLVHRVSPSNASVRLAF
jgi:hypothetical protein